MRKTKSLVMILLLSMVSLVPVISGAESPPACRAT
jgi:hypothetical protein